MIYKDFQDKSLSLLGFGTMRLPVDENGIIDEAQVEAMVDTALKNGINYFDTAWPYHNGESERVIGKILKKYDRSQYNLATKFPGHQISSSYDPKAIFEKQLEKCEVDYFDFYLLHNVYEKSIDTYLDPKWGILDYFKEQKRLGKIKHLGFSTHASVKTLKRFLEVCGKDMEFCQIQLNYLDWTLQEAKEKVELLKEYNIPVWVMEPVRGGKLANLKPEDEALLKKLNPNVSIASWGFRFLQDIDNVHMILSGMSNMDQMLDNINTFENHTPLTEKERNTLFFIANGMMDSVPCTACRYCTEGCPMQLDIPELLKIYNEVRVSPVTNAGMRIEALPAEKRPSACVGCGKCTQICPQNINIPAAMKHFTEILKNIPSWEEICKQREAAQK